MPPDYGFAFAALIWCAAILAVAAIGWALFG